MPGLLLVIMIIVTLILLPYLNDAQANRERTGRTEELNVKPRREK